MTATKSDQSINCNNQYSAVTVKRGSTTVTTSKADCISVQQELVNKTRYKQQKALAEEPKQSLQIVSQS